MVKALRRLVEEEKVIRQGEGKKGSPYLYSWFQVPSISSEPENQKELSSPTPYHIRGNAGSLLFASSETDSESFEPGREEVVVDET